ncbi:MAG: amino acid dehydrogenase, partial [Geminicoccaceae bacterium]|nr:amino acid dehydrogenase [Geminicoccaceae bacterium]
DAIVDAAVDVFAPCALGGVINDATIDRLKVGIIAGSANNQLAEPRHGQALADRGVVYAPDYVINAGGIIQIASELTGGPGSEPMAGRVGRIGEVLERIFRRSEEADLPTHLIADRIAEERLAAGRQRREEVVVPARKPAPAAVG